MTSGLEPLALLATGVHTQPGVYALLLGSGVSTGAGIPTGWGVVQALVSRIAAATHTDDQAAISAAANDPEEWWAEHGDGEPLGYSNLLAAVGPTPAARRALLAGFFEPSDDDAADGLKVPSAAHSAIAQLVKRGYIRVILTSNFDRLLEKALEDAGIPPQVIARAEAVAGLTPLPHAPVTIIKLHGDYADLDMRNTLEELSTYPPEWDELLDRVLDEYGLLVSGWSADWDRALVAAMERTRRRRYPLYWDSRSSSGTAATRLLAQHRGTVIPATSADALFSGLLERVDALERLAEPALTTAMAVTRLKRYLPDPVRRIDLHDLVMEATERTAAVRRGTSSRPMQGSDVGQRLQDLYANYRQATEPLLALLSAGVFHDRTRTHTDLWVAVVQRLMQARTMPNGTFNEILEHARHYPALLALRAAGTISAHLGRDDVLLRLLTEPSWREPFGMQDRSAAYEVLDDYRVAPGEVVNPMPRWNGQRWLYPPSHLLRADLRESLRPYLPDEDDYRTASDRYEYLLAVFLHSVPAPYGGSRANPGEFIGERNWTRDGRRRAEIDFLEQANQAPDDWPWWPVVGGRDNLEKYVSELSEELHAMTRHG